MEVTEKFKTVVLEKLQNAEISLDKSVELLQNSNNDEIVTEIRRAIDYISSVGNMFQVNDSLDCFTIKDIVEIVVECGFYHDDYEVEIPDECNLTDLFGLVPQKYDEKYLKWTIDVGSGNVEGWPKGMKASTNLKFVDAGVYGILAKDGVLIRKFRDYVPEVFNIKECEFGDYFHLDVDENGHIVNWEQNFRYSSDNADEKITFQQALKNLLNPEEAGF